MSTMLAMTATHWIMALSLFCVCVLLMLIILVQKGRGGGLASAFGGGGGSSSAFGGKTGDVFTGITVVLAAVFLILTVTGNFVLKSSASIPGPAVQGVPAPQGGTPAVPVSAADSADTDEEKSEAETAEPQADTAAPSAEQGEPDIAGDAPSADTEE